MITLVRIGDAPGELPGGVFVPKGGSVLVSRVQADWIKDHDPDGWQEVS